MTDNANGFIEIKDRHINQALKNIYTKKVDVKKEIEPALFQHTWSNLNKSVDIAFGKVEFGNPDYDFVNQLKNNNAVFAAFKTHREQNDLVPNLWDENGKLRSFSEFKKTNEHIVSKYEHWLRTEYDTAVIRARNAANFQSFKRDADLYPNLEWLPSTSIEPRGEHVKFYGIVKPTNDPFWSNNYPGDLWNCKCGITNTDKEPTEKTPSTDYTKPQGLEENPATSGALFSNKNAYVKNAYEGANEAVERHVKNAILKEQYNEVLKWGKENIINKMTYSNISFGERKAVFVKNSFTENMKYGELFDAKIDILRNINSYLPTHKTKLRWLDNQKPDEKHNVYGYHVCKTKYKGNVEKMKGRDFEIMFEDKGKGGIIFYFIKFI